ncbi:MAG: hypothetical protein ACK40P_14100 [Pseudanabaena sp.]
MIVLLNTHKPDRLFLKSNIDRPSPPINVIAYSPHQTAIAPHHHQNPIAFSPNSNSDCPLSPQTRSPISQHQPAIAPHHIAIRYPNCSTIQIPLSYI